MKALLRAYARRRGTAAYVRRSGPASRWGAGSVALALGVSALLVGCAQPDPPPGGEPDRFPPAVVEMVPQALSVLPGLRGPVLFRFDERISERGVEGSVLVSPVTGEVRVERGRREVRVEVAGGWVPGVVYHVTLLPGIQDLFGNQRRDPAELVFSTGPEIPETAIAGVLVDRLTGAPVVTGGRVEAIPDGDALRYVAQADSAGFFALRAVPPGSYQLVGYQDQNRNRQLDGAEPRAAEALTLASADTAVATLELLVPDTTPAQVVRGEAVDSAHVRIFLDDPVDPARPLDAAVQLWALPDSIPVPVATVLHAHELAAQRARDAAQRAEAGAEDTLLAEAAPRGGVTEPVPPDTGDLVLPPGAGRQPIGPGRPPRGAPARPSAVAPPGARAGPPLPSRELEVLLATPLRAGSYQVTVFGVTNIHGLTGGGGSATFDYAPPAGVPGRPQLPPDTARPPLVPDTARPPLVPDTPRSDSLPPPPLDAAWRR